MIDGFSSLSFVFVRRHRNRRCVTNDVIDVTFHCASFAHARMSADYQDGVVGADDADETEPSYGEDCVDDANAMSRMKRMKRRHNSHK